MRTFHYHSSPYSWPCLVPPITILEAVCPSSLIDRSSFTLGTYIGLFLALAIYGPQYSAMSPYIRGTSRNDPVFIWACTAVWIVSSLSVSSSSPFHVSPLTNKFAEISNLITHITLRNLRPAGSRKRAIPQGYGFSLVSFPNYFFESLAWFAIAFMTGSWTGNISPFTSKLF